jgi:hypothetical protein
MASDLERVLEPRKSIDLRTELPKSDLPDLPKSVRWHCAAGHASCGMEPIDEADWLWRPYPDQGPDQGPDQRRHRQR